MDYGKHYNLLIEKARNRNLSDDIYVENHHVKPKCIKVGKLFNETVKLTGREHFIVHYLLHKKFPKNEKLLFALHRMIHGHQNKYFIVSSIQYEKLRIKWSESIKGEKNHFYGKTHKPESKQKISEAKKGKKNPMFGKTHKPESRKTMKGKKRSPESKQKMSEAKKGKKHPGAKKNNN